MKDLRTIFWRLIIVALGFALVSGCSKKPKAPGTPTSPQTETLMDVPESGEASKPAASSRAGRTTVASITLGQKIEANHMILVNQTGDGATAATEVEGVPCHMIASQPGLPPAYFYFRLDSGLKFRQAEVLVTVEYFDAASGAIAIDYDSFDEYSRNLPYTRIPTRVELRNDNRWHKAVFLLEYPRFQQGMHDGGDFRIALSGSRLFVRSVQVTQK